MKRQTSLRAAMLTVAAIALPLLSACSDDPKSSPAAAALLAREAVVPVSVVTQYFPDVSTEASTGPTKRASGTRSRRDRWSSSAPTERRK
jgi:hypothetical protein